MSARLSRLPGVTFAFNRRGINLEDPNRAEFFKSKILVRRVFIRGIGQNELVAILREEFESLEPEDKKRFRPL